MTLCDKAYNHLSRMLARGVLKPDQKLSERSVSLACGVSRIPVREAIRRLVEEGVLYQKSQSGLPGVCPQDTHIPCHPKKPPSPPQRMCHFATPAPSCGYFSDAMGMTASSALLRKFPPPLLLE